MDCFIGIDLGSTTTKAVFLDENDRIIGRGITNSRSNYTLACQIAKEEAEINARSVLLWRALQEDPDIRDRAEALLGWLAAKFAAAQFFKQLEALEKICYSLGAADPKVTVGLNEIFASMHEFARTAFTPQSASRSDFFRDLASALYLKKSTEVSKNSGLAFERLASIFDKAILLVENQNFAAHYPEYLRYAETEVVKMPEFSKLSSKIQKAIAENIALRFQVRASVGTGYGRLTLPFPKEQIRSEILCHGLGAHYMFPGTRTILDIGGQDTKAIQIDSKGIVTGFQMNDRCAAGCGRYLGYIADEMNMGVHELGPLAMQSNRPAKINSTCTVFAGAELRERLALGEKREDILSGLHRAIILRAMSLLARSGGVTPEFTFTGGVAKNEAAVSALKQLVSENYGEMSINISPNSIFTGAVGAALFAKRDLERNCV